MVKRDSRLLVKLERLKGLSADPHASVADLAMAGAQALWTGSTKRRLDIVVLGTELLGRATGAPTRTQAPEIYAEAGLAAPFAGVHAAWSEGRSYVRGDATLAYAGLEKIICFTLTRPEGDHTNAQLLARAVFSGLVARAGELGSIIMTAPPSAWPGRGISARAAYNAYFFGGNALQPINIRLRNNHPKPSSTPQEAVSIEVGRRFASDALRTHAAPYYDTISGLPMAQKMEAAVRHLGGLMRSEYDGTLNTDETTLLNAITADAIPFVQSVIAAQQEHIGVL